jgi:hypothetical protein
MRFEFSCTCGQIYRVEYRFAGRKTMCQTCGEIIGIPVISLAKEPSRPVAPSSAPTSRAPERQSLPAREPPTAPDQSDTDDASTIESRFDLPVRAAQPRKRLPARMRVSKPKKPVEESPGAPLPILTRNTSARNTRGQGIPKWAMVSIVAVAGLAGVAGIGMAVSSAFKEEEEPAGPVVKQYAAITHEIGNFSIEYPTDWVAKNGGGTNGIPPWVSFEGNDSHVRVRGDAGAVVIGSMADAGADIGLNIPENELAAGARQLAPVVVVHDHEKDAVKGDYLDFQESTPEVINAEGFGEGRMSTFSGKSGFTRYKGLRCTFLASDWQYNIVCTIPETKFERYEPVFRKMIATFKR